MQIAIIEILASKKWLNKEKSCKLIIKINLYI